MRLGRPVGSGWLRGGWGGWDLIRSGGIGQDRGGGAVGLGVQGQRGQGNQGDQGDLFLRGIDLLSP